MSNRENSNSFEEKLEWIEEHKEELKSYRTYGLPPYLSKQNTILKLLGFGLALLALLFLIFAIYKTTTHNNTNIQFAYLQDGSELHLLQGSSFDFSMEKNREVTLRGDAFFDVFHDQNNPFYIFWGQAQIEVLGTSFLLREKEGEKTIWVRDGKVKVRGKWEQPIILQKNDKLIFKDDLILNQQNITYQGRLFHEEYENQKLSKVLKDLCDFYGLSLQWDESIQSKGCAFNGTFDGVSFTEALAELALAFDMTYELNSNRLSVITTHCKN